MKHRNALGLLILCQALCAGGSPALAASVTNMDKDPQTLIVTEGDNQSQLVVAAGETLQFCPSGCFVTMPNGDHEPLLGDEQMQISNGRAVFK